MTMYRDMTILQASVLSRITTVLPFVPFTLEEKKAICSEALFALGGEFLELSSPETIETAINTALSSYCAIEGARSLHRAISNQLVDII
jgi:ATP-dependent Clp protease ATP-binding subunit ClpA